MNRRRKTIYWVTTGFVALIFFATGIANLIPVEHISHDMAHLGYPPYFHIILGAWKILGAIVIILPGLPRVKEWAYAGMIFDVTGAALSRFASGDNLITIILPLLIACLVVTSWWLRLHDQSVVARKPD